MKALAILVLLGACAHPVAPVITTAKVPEQLKNCPASIPPPPAPKPPRTVESIASAYNQMKSVAYTNEAALLECKSRLDRLNQMVAP